MNKSWAGRNGGNNIQMKERMTSVERKTKETEIRLKLDLTNKQALKIDTGVPFFNHLLNVFAFHGNFSLELEARGDLEVDAHHLIEDSGIVLGEAFNRLFTEDQAIARFGFSVLPMDEALVEVALDVCGRATLVYEANFPQPLVGSFDVALLKEFFGAFVQKAKISLHITVRRGENSHHMAEALFKAFGRALSQAYQIVDFRQQSGISTKGLI